VVRLNIYFKTILDSMAFMRSSNTLFWNNITDLTLTLLEQVGRAPNGPKEVLTWGHWGN
jgi:hypothetical protein